MKEADNCSSFLDKSRRNSGSFGPSITDRSPGVTKRANQIDPKTGLAIGELGNCLYFMIPDRCI
jgi:hypothetical protein